MDVSRSAIIAFAVAGVLLLGFGLWVAGAPSADEPSGEAVVVHAGGKGERLDHALQLMESDAAPTLVIMRGSARTWPQANRLCGQQDPYEVLCPFPDPDTTIGEALALSDLVDERGWTQVVTVTSDYHLRRAAFLDRRCADVKVTGSAAPTELGPADMTARVIREMAGMVLSVIVTC